MTKILPPTPSILRMADSIEGAIDRFLEARKSISPLGKYESEDEAVLLFNLAIRDAEGILALARTDLTLLPAANVLARAVFEVGLKAAWMVRPDDPFEREVRWLAHLAEEERILKAVCESAVKHGGNPVAFKQRHDQISGFRTSVARLLPMGYSQLPGNPGVESMLDDLGQKQTYSIYRLLAQYVHGGNASTWLYRRNFGTLKQIGEFISPVNWQAPLHTAWYSLQVFGEGILRSLKSEIPEFVTVEENESFGRELRELDEGTGATVH
jgi:Family of unknown function (DUF5677)